MQSHLKSSTMLTSQNSTGRGRCSCHQYGPGPFRSRSYNGGRADAVRLSRQPCPEELQAAYYRVLAHTRTLSPDDEMLCILEAMGILALLTRHTPKDIADERERFQELLELHRPFSDEAQQKMLDDVRELETRISDLPRGIKASLDPDQIAKMLGESLRQHFIQSGISETVKGLQATSAAMTSSQKELTTALHNLFDSHGGVVSVRWNMATAE